MEIGNYLLFAGLDTAFTNKDNGDIWAEFGKKAAVSTVSSSIGAGFSVLGGVASGAMENAGTGALSQGVVRGGLAMAQTGATSVATSMVGAINFRTGEFSSDAFLEGIGGGMGLIANTLGAGVSAGLGSYLSNPNMVSVPRQKYLGGAISLGTSAAGELTKYGVHALGNLAQGGGWDSFSRAYDDMGGLTLNLLNVSSIAKIFGVDDYKADKMRTGLFELHITSGGVSSRFGTGGIDVGGALFDLVKSGIDYQRQQTAARRYTEIIERMLENDKPFDADDSMAEWMIDPENNELPNIDELLFEAEENRQGNIFIIKDKQGNEITLFELDGDNPALAGLIKQIDEVYKSIPAIKEAGCNFLLTLAYAELVTGQNLTADQRMDIWREAAKNSNILLPDGEVKSQNLLAKITLEKLGRTDIGLSFGWNQSDGTLIGYRIRVPYGTGDHFITGDVSKGILWNPGNTTYEYGKATHWRDVYVYAK
jgi:hypothetical protein